MRKDTVYFQICEKRKWYLADPFENYAHLAVENQAGNSDHNVVVNGYRESDGKISVADLEKGLYILQINAGEFRQTEKFIVK